MGNKSSIPGDCCAGLEPDGNGYPQGWCSYSLSLSPGPWPGVSGESLDAIRIEKLNALVNYITCANNQQDVINLAQQHPKLAVVLCLPPALPYIYSIKAINADCSRTAAPTCSQNSDCTNYATGGAGPCQNNVCVCEKDGDCPGWTSSGVIACCDGKCITKDHSIQTCSSACFKAVGVLSLENDVILIQNPYYIQAQNMEALFFGASSSGAFPCVSTYNFPIGVYKGTTYTQPEHYIYSSNGVPNTGYNACLSAFFKALETGVAGQCSYQCIGDPGVVLPHVSSWDGTQTDYMEANIQKCLTDFTQCQYVFTFPNQTGIGPYETAKGPNYGQPCPNLNSPTCTYQICKKNPNLSWFCNSQGKCCPSDYPGGFPSEDECYDCFNNGTCGSNVCCLASKNGQSCYNSSPPPTSPGSGRNLLIEGAIGIGIIIVLLIIIYILIKVL